MGGRNTLETEIFGREVSFDYSERWIGYSILGLRLIMGWTMFYAGIDKLLDPEWTAAGYLSGVSDTNPFLGVWQVMAGNPMVDQLVIWGLTLTGVGLLLGLFLRTSAFFAALMMVLFWASSLPLQHAILIDDHLVYALLLFGLGAFGAGRILGLDSRIEETDLVKDHPWLRYLLG